MPKAIEYNIALGSTFPASPAVVAKTFNQRFNQIVRLAVCLGGHPFANQAALISKAAWDARLAATDNTRIILSPLFSGSKITSSKAIETGVDTNATYRGQPIYFGEGTSKFSCEFLNVNSDAMDTFVQVVAPFAQQGNAAVQATWIGCNNDGHIVSTGTFDFLPMLSLSCTTRGTEGLNSSDKNMMQFYLPPNWDGGTSAPEMYNVSALGGDVDLRTYP